MAKYGDTFENRITGEHAVILRGDEDGGGKPILASLTLAVGGAVAGEHTHPHLQERFHVISGQLAVRLDGQQTTLGPGQDASAPAGTAHDWWNAGDQPAHVLVEISPPDPRFVAMIATLWGLANDGKTNRAGMPKPLQLSLIGREFDDIIRFTKPPRPIQLGVTALLAPLARARGYRPIYPQYLTPHKRTVPAPAVMQVAGLTAA
jgi:mannose-6-phosphate isomerase-like protein (cupin superfamily)